MKISEKCRVAGIKPKSMDLMQEDDIEVALGNTIPVGLIGCDVVPVFRSCIQAAKLEDE